MFTNSEVRYLSYQELLNERARLQGLYDIRKKVLEEDLEYLAETKPELNRLERKIEGRFFLFVSKDKRNKIDTYKRAINRVESAMEKVDLEGQVRSLEARLIELNQAIQARNNSPSLSP